MQVLRFVVGFLLVVLGPGAAFLGGLIIFFGLFGAPFRALLVGAVLFVLGLGSTVVGLRLRNFDFTTYRATGFALRTTSQQALKPVLARALKLAQSNRFVTFWHILWALTETEEVRQILSPFDIAPGELASVCQRRCSDLPTRRRWRLRKPQIDPQVKASLQRAVIHSISSEQPSVRAEHILLDLISPEAPDEIRETLVMAGLRGLPLRAFVAHRTLEPTSPSIPAHGVVEVLMLNDEFTTKEFVQNALCKIFDLPESVAERLMLEVHQSGEASLGIMDAEDAREKISRTLADARTNGFPLRFAVK